MMSGNWIFLFPDVTLGSGKVCDCIIQYLLQMNLEALMNQKESGIPENHPCDPHVSQGHRICWYLVAIAMSPPGSHPHLLLGAYQMLPGYHISA